MELQNRAGTFYRLLSVEAEQGRARGEVIDNVHHFVVELQHDGSIVTAATGKAIRVPWTTCPAATLALSALVGSSVEPGRRVEVDQAQQCTHLLDTAKLALAQVARGGRRHYEVLVCSTEQPDVCTAKIARDGEQLFEWTIRGNTVVHPAAFAGHDIIGRAVWPSQVEHDTDLREAALALRRSVFVFRSRPRSSKIFRARELKALSNVCFSFQSVRVNDAVRPEGFRELEPDDTGILR